MDESDRISRQEKKIKHLEQELNDLRQGLVIVQDYYRDVKRVSEDREAARRFENLVVRPLIDDEQEFNGIWKFHKEMLIPDPTAHMLYSDMYDAFLRYCSKTGRAPVEQEVFEFVFARMEDPTPVSDRGEWKGCRLMPERE
jgi:DICT domain-containing protein